MVNEIPLGDVGGDTPARGVQMPRHLGGLHERRLHSSAKAQARSGVKLPRPADTFEEWLLGLDSSRDAANIAALYVNDRGSQDRALPPAESRARLLHAASTMAAYYATQTQPPAQRGHLRLHEHVRELLAGGYVPGTDAEDALADELTRVVQTENDPVGHGDLHDMWAQARESLSRLVREQLEADGKLPVS